MPRCCFDRLKSPCLRIPPGSPSSPRRSLYCTSRMRAQRPPPFIRCRAVSRHASGASIGVALAFYIGRQCVIFGNRGEREEGARFFFFFFTHSTADVILDESNASGSHSRKIWCFVLYIFITSGLLPVFSTNTHLCDAQHGYDF